jgi:hypothetical protein
MKEDRFSLEDSDTQSSSSIRSYAWPALITSLVLLCACLVGVMGVAGASLFKDMDKPQLSYAEIVASAQATLNGTPYITLLPPMLSPTSFYPSLTPPAWPSPSVSLTPSPTSTNTKTTRRESPKVFIQQYYDLINKRQYARTFNMLSDGFKQRNHCCKPNGSFDDGPYKEWWNSIKKVEILQLRVEKWDQDRAVVEVKLRYNRMDGNIIDNWATFNLIGDPEGKSWLFE